MSEKRIVQNFGKSYEFSNEKKAICCNCKFGGTQFKIGKLTHLHCEDPKQYNQDKFDNEGFSAWDTLREFGNTCENFEPKQPIKKH